MNRYLRDRAMRRESIRGERDYARGRGGRSDREYSRSNRDRTYEDERFMDDYPRGNRDYARDREDYRGGRDYAHEEDDYYKKLKMLIERLRRKDSLGMTKDSIIDRAKQMGVNFKEFDEMEFYAVYLMMASDYSGMFSEPNTYIAMAKKWLDDDDVALSGSDKLCAYLYTIVLDEQI